MTSEQEVKISRPETMAFNPYSPPLGLHILRVNFPDT